MKTLRISATIVTLFISVLFVGCSDFSGKKVSGAKIPEYHGSYVLVDGAWVGLNADTVIDSDQPEILIYDPMVKTGMVTGDDLATLKRYLIIDQEVEEIHQTRDGPIVGYTSKSTYDMTTSFSGSDVDLRTRPVDGMDEIIVLTPAKPVQSGKYRLKTMHDSHSIDIENDLEADNRYIKWYLTLNDAENFSWDGWAARTYDRASSESAYNGRAILSLDYRPHFNFDILLDQLEDELTAILKDKDIFELASFRRKVLGFENKLEEKARKMLGEALERDIALADKGNAFSSLIALDEIAAQENIELHPLASGMVNLASSRLDKIKTNRTKLIEQISTSWTFDRDKLFKDFHSRNLETMFHPVWKEKHLHKKGVAVTENYIVYESPTGIDTSRIWIGNLNSMTFFEENGKYYAKINSYRKYNANGLEVNNFGFRTNQELYNFVHALLDARSKWEKRWQKSREIAMVAPTQFWSETIETPYNFNVVGEEVSSAKIELITNLGDKPATVHLGKETWRASPGHAKNLKWIKFKSLSPDSVGLTVLFLPFNEPDLSRFEGLTATAGKQTSRSETAYDPTSSFNADSASSRSNTPSFGTGSQNSSTSPQTNNQTTTATLPRDVEKILSIVNTPSKPVTVGLTDKLDGSYEFTRSTKLDSGGIEKTKNVITIQGKLFHYDIYTVISDKLANGTPSYVASHKKYAGLVKRKTNDSITISLVKEERLVGYPRETMPTGVIRTRWPWGQGAWTFGFTGDYAYDKRNQNTKFKKVK